jgi:hypothetical protein
LLRCLFLALHLLEDFKSAPALRLINRDMPAWSEHFQILYRGRVEQLRGLQGGWAGHFREDWHEISLLRGLLESVGGEMDVIQHQFDLHRTANDSFAAFGELLGLELSHARPGSFGSFDKEKMTDALRQSTMFEGQLDVLPGQELLQHIPIGVSEAEHGILPAALVHDIGSEKVHEVRGQM